MVENRYRREYECESVFHKMGTIFNANTPENHPVVFSTDEQFKAGMTILAVCAKMYPEIKIYAFQLMSNHIHLVVGGDRQTIQEFFAYYVERLGRYFDNRMDFFQPLVERYVKLAGKAIGNASLRALMHTKASDKFYCLKIVDGFVSPLEFLDIETAESIFRDAKQYFYLISRKVESYSEVAKSIGEAIYYNDNDLYMAAMKISAENYNCRDPKILPAAEKIELARRLYFDYNASEKQLQRLISIDANLLKTVL